MENLSNMSAASHDGPAVYSAPSVTDHGSIAQVTRANVVGMVTDATFPAGTPLGHLTFSGV